MHADAAAVLATASDFSCLPVFRTFVVDVVYLPAVRMTLFSRPLVDVLSATLNCLVFDMSKILPTQIDSCSSKLFEGSTLTLYGTGSTPIADSQLGEPALQSRDQGRQQYVGGYAELHIKTQLEDCYRLLAIHPTAYLCAKGSFCHAPG